MNPIRVERQIGNGTLRLETGVLAKQAAGAVLTTYGETVTLSAVAAGPPRAGIDFFPLSCDYRERHAAAGKFPGGFLKREGRPTTKETLTSRLIDRPIRPMLPNGYNDEVQIQSFVLASDRQIDGDVLAMNGGRDRAGPFAAAVPGPARLGAAGPDRRRVRPVSDARRTGSQRAGPDRLRHTVKRVLMIEGFAREMPEDRMAEALMPKAHRLVRQICDLQHGADRQGRQAEDRVRAAAG